MMPHDTRRGSLLELLSIVPIFEAGRRRCSPN
jgi:hypothetical protein